MDLRSHTSYVYTRTRYVAFVRIYVIAGKQLSRFDNVLHYWKRAEHVGVFLVQLRREPTAKTKYYYYHSTVRGLLLYRNAD